MTTYKSKSKCQINEVHNTESSKDRRGEAGGDRRQKKMSGGHKTTMPSSDLSGKLAVVTGGSRGIGLGIGRRLAADGCDLVLVGRDPVTLLAASESIEGVTVRVCSADLRTKEGCEKVLRCVDGLSVNILINNAGATQGGDFLELSDELWEDGFALKFFGAVRVTRILWPQLCVSKGTVVNVIGGFARSPDADFMISGSVNAAFANFSKALAGRGLKDDVNVNAVHPGLIVTERLEGLLAQKAKQTGTTLEDTKDQWMKKDGIRRLGEAQDVAELVFFLCTPKARHIHGTAIAVDGGATKGNH